MLGYFFRQSTVRKHRVDMKQNADIDSAASSGGQGM